MNATNRKQKNQAVAIAVNGVNSSREALEGDQRNSFVSTGQVDLVSCVSLIHAIPLRLDYQRPVAINEPIVCRDLRSSTK
jgi:hypothetical protein